MIEDLIELKKVGPKTKKIYEKLGIFKPIDLLYYFPRDYEIIKDIFKIIDLSDGDVSLIKGKIVGKPSNFQKNKLKIVSVNVKDDTGIIKLIWFNSPFIVNIIKNNEELVFRGKVTYFRNTKSIVQPKIWTITKYEEEKNKISPLYNLTKGINNDLIKNNIKEVFGSYDNNENEYLEKEFLNNNNMLNINDAYCNIHFPKDMRDLVKAHNRLAFEELLIFILSIKLNKNKNSCGRNDLVDLNFDCLNNIILKLPYKLTNDQISCIKDIINDFNACKKINRLIEGDVGSGKSIIVFLIAILLSSKKVQTVIMVPTEVLAIQHYNNLINLINRLKLDIGVGLLTGSLKVNERKSILENIKNNNISIIIGTHACYSKDVIYNDLALVVIDEQHRFGVNQRKSIEEKGTNVNVIAMSATPIPRTLSLLIYMGMDISRIKEKPKNRLPIKNGVIDKSKRLFAYEKIIEEILKGHKCYIICPSVEGSDEYGNFMNTQNVYEYEKIINEYIKNQKLKTKPVIRVLHGKLKSDEKEKIINNFINSKIDILISTTVVEVGVDCKDATLIMIEDAPRFGLATLHQLRGRVGRSDLQSYAIFVDTINTEESKNRLKVLKDSNDGFYIAECDLDMRGPGDIFGIKQSGNMEFKVADIYNDKDLLKLASEYSDLIIKNQLLDKKVSFHALKSQLDEYMKNGYTI